MEKTQLNIAINPESISESGNLPLSVNASSVSKWTDENGKARTARKHLLSVSASAKKAEEILTDFFARYAYHIAPKLCYTALQTIYTNHADPKIDRLMKECLEFMHSSVDTLSDFSDYLTAKYEAEGGKTVMQEKKTHKYKTVMIDGKRKRMECLPYDTLELTDYGKEMFAETAKNGMGNDLDVQDLIQEAVLSILEIVRYGLANDTFTLWAYSNYIYKRINAYIRRNARRYQEVSFESMQAKAKTDEEFASENKLFDVYTFENADFGMMKESLLSFLAESLPTKANKENIIHAFTACKLNGKTEAEEAEVLKVSRRMVSKYILAAERHLSTDEAKKYIRDMIYA